MWLFTISYVFVAYFQISLGHSVSPPFSTDCVTLYPCKVKTDCPKYFPICSAGRCCRQPKFPCSSDRRGPRCGFPGDRPCKPGYTCHLFYCCRDVTPPTKCPFGHISGPLCSNSQCPAGFTCMKGRCCKRRIKTQRCPKGMLYTGRCNAGPWGRCRMGSTCINGACCRGPFKPLSL